MSVIRKKPFIESVLDTLTTSELSALKYVMNNGGNNVSVSLVSGSFEKGEGKIITSTITPVYIEVESNKVYSAILIWNASYCVAIPYHRFQDVKLIKINPSTRTYEEIKEYCDINELRRIIDDTAESSFDADGEAGQVLTADGEGGVQWKDNPQIIALTTNSGTLTSDQVALASAGNTVITLSGEYYYRFSKSVSAIVFKATPRVDNDTTYIDNITIDLSDNTYSASYETVAAGEGFTPTYDDELSDSSTNAVQNKVINAALATKADAEDYAKISDLENGTIIPEKSKVAKNLEPVSQASGSTQTAPFINQGTATNNNDAQAEVDTGTLGQHLEKRGNTIAYNELLYNPNFANTDGWSGVSGDISASDNILTYTITTVSASGVIKTSDSYGVDLVNGHKYLALFKLFCSKTTHIRANFPSQIVFALDEELPANAWKSYHRIGTMNNASINSAFYIYPNRSSELAIGDTFQVRDVCVIDLTQWFDGDIPQDLLDNPSNFYRYYQGSLAYNVGQLVNCNGRYLVNGGQNVLNPSATYNLVVPNRKYNYKGSSTTTITYYDKAKNSLGTESVSNGSQFTTPANCIYIASSVTSATICLYYSGEDYSKDIPYEAPKVYDTGNEELLAFDKKLPDGTIHRNTGSYTFTGDEVWEAEGSDYYTQIPIAIKGISIEEVGNIICSNGLIKSKQKELKEGTADNGIAVGSSSSTYYVIVRKDGTTTSAVATATYMTGATIEFEIPDADKITSQGTPFSENMDINDMGNMAWYSAYTDENTNNPVEVPQGCKIFYPAWYVGFIDTLGQREDIDWSAENIVSQTELGVVDTKHDDLYAIMKENIGGTLRHQLIYQCAISNEIVNFENTKYIDIYDARTQFIYYGDNIFRVELSDMKAPGTNTISHVICPTYKTLEPRYSSVFNTAPNMSCFLTADGGGVSKVLYFKNTSYSTLSDFVSAMKGILLAYEKASE